MSSLYRYNTVLNASNIKMTKLKISVLRNSQANERNTMNKQRDATPEKRFYEFRWRKNLISLGRFWEGGEDRSKTSERVGIHQAGTKKENVSYFLSPEGPPNSAVPSAFHVLKLLSIWGTAIRMSKSFNNKKTLDQKLIHENEGMGRK